jgi:hypothetical protein
MAAMPRRWNLDQLARRARLGGFGNGNSLDTWERLVVKTGRTNLIFWLKSSARKK